MVNGYAPVPDTEIMSMLPNTKDLPGQSILITGAAGYIGGQSALHLRELGHTVMGIDTQPCPAGPMRALHRFYQEDFASPHGLDVITRVRPQAILHCAGTSLVGPSRHDPAGYFDNNFVRTLRMMDHLRQHHIAARVIFSSSAAVYGEPESARCLETDALRPVSAYGDSKLMVETMLRRYHEAYAQPYVALRYFNACGADPWGRHGQRIGATHILARVLESMLNHQEFTLNGEDYDTPDGTCVRDYLHVEDIAQAHALALAPDLPPGEYNLGLSQPLSNLEVMRACERVTGVRLKWRGGPRRPGDPARLTADPQAFVTATAWRPRYGLDDMIRHAWKWYQS